MDGNKDGQVTKKPHFILNFVWGKKKLTNWFKVSAREFMEACTEDNELKNLLQVKNIQTKIMQALFWNNAFFYVKL